MTPMDYERLRRPLLDALHALRVQCDENSAPIRAELVRLQEIFYSPRLVFELIEPPVAVTTATDANTVVLMRRLRMSTHSEELREQVDKWLAEHGVPVVDRRQKP